MPSSFDPSDFEDHEFKAARQAAYGAVTAPPDPPLAQRPPTRNDVDSQVSEMQKKLTELRRAQEQLERERAGLEETRRRQAEFDNGRGEMLDQLTRGISLLEEAELDKRREAQQITNCLADLRGALDKVRALREEQWTTDTFQEELSRALAVIDNARMEWNTARSKFPVLNQAPEEVAAATVPRPGGTPLAEMDWPTLCRLGIALTWPIVLTGLAIFVVLLLRK